MNTNNKEALTFDEIKKIILDSGVLDEHDKNVGGDLYSPKGNQELTADALAQYIAPRLLQDNEDTEVQEEAEYGIFGNDDFRVMGDIKKAHRELNKKFKPSSKVEKLKELQRRFSTNLDYGAQWADLVKILNVLIEDEE